MCISIYGSLLMRHHYFLMAPQHLTSTSVIKFLSLAPNHGNTRDPTRKQNDTNNDKVGFTNGRFEGPFASVSVSTT